MTDSPIDARTLKDLPQGAMETLLNTARAETSAAVAFVALYRADGSFAITTSMEEDVPWEGRSLASLARSIWLDPDLTVGKVLVSSARVEGGRRKRRQAHVASVVLSDSAVSDLEWGLLSIIAQDDRRFTDDQLERIGALSKNLASYLSARERMIDDLMDAVHKEETGPEPRASADNGAESEREEIFIETVRDDVTSSPRSLSIDADMESDYVDYTIDPDPDDAIDAPHIVVVDTDAASDFDDLIMEPDRDDAIITPRSRVTHAEMRSRFDDLGTREGSNGVQGAPDHSVTEEPEDEIHVVPTRPRGVVELAESPPAREHEIALPEAGDTEPDEPRSPDLTIHVAEPGLINQISEAMEAIGESETVALIHLKIAYDDTATVVPTEAARVLVAKSIKDFVRYDDVVARVGENSFVVVARQRPGAPGPAIIEKRLLKAARRATGWTDSGPSFRTDYLVIDPDSVDEPEDVLFSLLHP